MMELNANSEMFMSKMNLEDANLQKENASYSQELKDASIIIHKQENVLSHTDFKFIGCP